MAKFSVDPDIKKAFTLHTDFYTDPDVYMRAKESIFAPSWQYIGCVDDLEGPANILPFTLLEKCLDEPLVLTKDVAGEIHCLSNVCTHRGNLVAWQAGCSSHLRCRYHGRVFGLDGRFQFMPEFQTVENFPCASDHLFPLPIFQWGKLLFASLNPQKPVADFLGEMIARVPWLPVEKLAYRADLSTRYNVAAYWALYCENYLEGFHIPFVHPGLSGAIEYNTYKTEIFGLSNLQIALAKPGEAHFEVPTDAVDAGQRIAAYYFWVFPNMMFNFYPWGLSFNLVEPTGVDSCAVHFKVFVWDETKLEQGAGSGLNQVELEDEAVVQQVQKGIRSRFYTQGRYAPEREQGTHHFHQLLAQFY